MEIPSDGNFILRDLPGSGKRVDVLCRTLAACFDWAPQVVQLDNLEFVVFLSHERMLLFRNPSNALQKGETWWGEVVRKALTGNPPDFVEEKITPLNIFLKEILKKERSYLYVLEEKGIPLSTVSVVSKDSQYSFMLGNHLGFNESTQELIQNLKIPQVSLGHLSYLGSHCVASVISHFERMKT